MDISRVKEYYSSKSNDELIELAKNEANELTTEALQALKDEFRMRNLDLEVFESQNKKSSSSIPTSAHLLHAVNQKEAGLTNDQILASLMKTGLNETDSRMIINSMGNQFRLMLKSCKDHMIYGGGICVVGLLITIWTYTAAENGGTYVVAWGAILFGGIRFFMNLAKREKYQRILDDFNDEQDLTGVETTEE